MKSYTAQIIYSIKCDGAFTGQYDEQWRLIFANNEEEAMINAKHVAQEKVHGIVDRHGRVMSWELVAIKDLKAVDLEQGSLLSSSVIDVTTIPAPLWEQ